MQLMAYKNNCLLAQTDVNVERSDPCVEQTVRTFAASIVHGIRRLLLCTFLLASWPASADFIAVGHPGINYSGHLYLLGVPGASGTVADNSGAFNQDFVIGASGVVELAVPVSQFLAPDDTVLNKALQVTSASPITGYFLNQAAFSSDMTHLLDLSALGTEYRVLTWDWSASGGYPMQMSITAVADGTTVNITPTVALDSGQSANTAFNVALNAGESVIYHVYNPWADLSGSLITSNNPVAVFSGSMSAFVPNSAVAADHLFAQMPPINHWSTEYVVPETARTGGAGNVVRILAATNNTQVQVNGVTVVLNAGDFHQIVGSHDLHVLADNPVLVGQFLQGHEVTNPGDRMGDPAFTIIPGTDKLLDDYMFAAPTGAPAFGENYLSLAVPTAELSSLTLNGAVVNVSGFLPVGTTGYSAGTVLVAPGAGRIQANAPFVVTLMGVSEMESYLTILGASYSPGASADPDHVPPPVPAPSPTADIVSVPWGGPLGWFVLVLSVLGLGGVRLARRGS